MTKAADELHMTQSGVSQHIKHLEEILEVILFDRIKQKLIPTDKAKLFYHSSKEALDRLEHSLVDLKGIEQTLTGTIHIGLPVEFGNTMVLPSLAKFSRTHPELNFKIRYGFASGINQLLLDGQMDFAFIDDHLMDKHINTIEVYQEILHLVTVPSYLEKNPNNAAEKKFLLDADFVDYTEDESVLKMWFLHHYKISSPKLKVKAHLMDVHGLGRLIENGMGLGVLPMHHIHKLQRHGVPLIIFRGQAQPLKNKISLAYLSEKTPSLAVKTLMDFLKKELTIFNS